MKHLSIISAIALIMMFGCEETPNDGGNNAQPQIKLITDNVLNISENSGTAIIKYELIDMAYDLEVKAEADVEWIGNWDYRNMGTITFQYEKNETAEARTGVITITYGDSSATITVNQKESEVPSVINIEAPMLVGLYYGSQVSGYISYYLAFSDKGLSSYDIGTNIYYWDNPNTYYYIADIYTNQTPSDEKCQIPDGVYELGRGGAMHSINKDTSWYQENDENGFPFCQCEYNSGKLVVENGTLSLTVNFDRKYLDETGSKYYQTETHHVTYSGDYSLLDMSNLHYQ